jgi:peroxiredoxin
MQLTLRPLAPASLGLLFSLTALGCPAAKEPDAGAGPTGSATTQAATAAPGAGAVAIASATTASPTPSASATSAPSAPSAAAQAAPALAIGAVAPDFSLPDLDGKTVKLGDYKGKIVVLEWFNPGCPFIKVAHEKRELQKLAAKYAAKGVVFLAINSGAPGKQGNALEENQKAKAAFGIGYPILRDQDGAVGHRYGASNTPHLFVIAKDGTLAYAGGLDDTAGGDMDKTDKITPWLQNALDAVLAGKKPEIAQTKPWGCKVKYAD